ncbi:hypothetical protein Ae201684P_004535 [Aphanomyces euteiches]|uniref:PLAC8 family protein n=1 Tax=Aphanomyces euteiches TaxID=100861 RepID=A0A6G0XDU1_9STRA|nr:hypothetical protein Ae201684_006193 [Aphanomyces euteiches]KAH9068836.1 hypothetical protein Ae201684P_004535 [Aphanomyces euteiches]KAH9145847.1 hypothetical protein AeRB84_010241 [Aphanomyces euteiches]
MSKPEDDQVELAMPVAVSFVASEVPRLTDTNGILLGQWSIGFCSCFSSIFPNCCMAFWCPCISSGQTMARIGSSGMTYMVLYGVLYLFSAGFATSSISIWTMWLSLSGGDAINSGGSWSAYFQPCLVVLAAIVLTVARGTVRARFEIPGNGFGDCLCSCCCSCCVIAQMATHVEAYTPGQCDFHFKDTLPAYKA